MLTNWGKIRWKPLLSFKVFFKLGIFWSCECRGVRTFGQRGGAWTCFLPSLITVWACAARMGLHFPTSLWVAVPWHRRDLVGEREGDQSQLCACGILLKRCWVPVPALSVFYLCKTHAMWKRITPWDQILLHGLWVSCLCTLFLLFSQLNPHRNSLAFQKSCHLHSQLFWHTGEHSHTCRGTVPPLGCALVLRGGHTGLSSLRVKKDISGCAESP